MQKRLKRILWLTPILLFCLYWLGIYLSLKNPMEEIVYSENGGVMRYITVKKFTQSIGSLRVWKEDEEFQIYPYSEGIVSGDEQLSVLMFHDSSDWTFRYEVDIAKDVKRFVLNLPMILLKKSLGRRTYIFLKVG